MMSRGDAVVLSSQLTKSCIRTSCSTADPTAIWLRGGVWGGWDVSEAMEGFVTSLARMSGARNDLRQPLALDGCRDPFVGSFLHWNSHTLHAMQHKYILRFDGTSRGWQLHG
jgi:hypothetical protein